MGYKRGTDFTDMPKIRININFDHFVSVYDKFNRVRNKDIKLKHAKNALLIELPMSALGEPDTILSSIKTYLAHLPLEATAWRTLRIMPHVAPAAH